MKEERRARDLLEDVPDALASRPQKRAGLLLAILLLTSVGVVIFSQLSKNAASPDDGQIPVIEAVEGPNKLRPEQPGGAEIPYQDRTVYGLLGPAVSSKGPERLLPPPEEPMLPPSDKTPAATAAKSLSPKEETVGSSATTVAKTELQKPPTVSDKNTKKDEVIPQDSGETSAAFPAASVSALPSASAPPKTQGASTSGGKGETPREAESNFAIQLASLSDKNAAEGERKRLQRKHADALGKVTLGISKASLGEKQLWRVQSSALPEEKARALCATIRAQKSGCLVVRR